MDQQLSGFDAKALRTQADLQAATNIERINKITGEVDATRLFVSVHATLAIGPADQISEASHGTVSAKIELLAYLLYPFFDKEYHREITPWDIHTCVKALEEIFMARTVLSSFADRLSAYSNSATSIVATAKAQAEVVRGSAYPEQISGKIIAIQAKFDSWFEQKVGIRPSKAQALLWAIERAQQISLEAFISHVIQSANELKSVWGQAKATYRKERSIQDETLLKVFKNGDIAANFRYIESLSAYAPEHLPATLEKVKPFAESVNDQEWVALLNLLGMNQLARNWMSEPTDVRKRPLYELPEGKVLLVDLPNALDMLWDAFEQVAKKDVRFFERYQKTRATWIEDKIVDSMSKLFKAEEIYRGLTYLDPDRPSIDGATAELDIAIYWKPYLVILEAKAKQFRLEGQLGDVGRLFTDLKVNVEDAFEQAKRAARYIDQTAQPQFTELVTGRKLNIDKHNLKGTYLVTVSFHHLAGFATRLAALEGIGLFKAGEYPLSISISDLEIVAESCSKPAVFLHYISKRLSTQRLYPNTKADELDFLGAYLDTRLQPSRLWERGGERPTVVWLSGWSDQFDNLFMFKRGELIEKPTIKLKVPSEIDAIINELHARDDEPSKHICFELLNLSDTILNSIAHSISHIRSNLPRLGTFRRITIHEDDTAISIVASLDQSVESLYQRTYFRVELEKYRRKAKKSIGLGILLMDRTRPFECAFWVDYPWSFNLEIEKFKDIEPPFVPAANEKLPGRNEPCICGSGKKFKYCCMPKIKQSWTIFS